MSVVALNRIPCYLDAVRACIHATEIYRSSCGYCNENGVKQL